MPSSEPDFRKAIGETIRKLRTDADLTLAELADRSGLSASWLGRLESGKHESTWEGLEEVAKGLGLSLSEFAAEIERMEKKGR
jgi:XRE family transcriptional regulator, fatty acid utilization regulator